MRGKPNTQAALLKGGIGLTLILAILLGLAMPGISLEREAPANPLEDQPIEAVTVLQVGEELLQGSPIAIPAGEQTKVNDAETEPSREQETIPQQTQPEETLPDTGSGPEGNDQGNQGDMGEDPADLDLAVVMTWYKYGTQEKQVSCGPMESVRKTINTAQLADGSLRYAFRAEGSQAGRLDRLAVSRAEGDGTFREVESQGTLPVTPPEAGQTRSDTFQVSAYWTADSGDRQKITFTFLIRWENVPDLELTLSWHRKDGQERKIPCAPGQAQTFSVADGDLAEKVFAYSFSLSGALAQEAVIRRCDYTTGSGDTGSFDLPSGSKLLGVAQGRDSETYYLNVLVEADGREIHFQYILTYSQQAEVKLRFLWREGGTLQRELLCAAGGSVTQRITGSQLSGGTIPYELALTGADSGSGIITSVICSADDRGGTPLEQAGNLALSIPQGASENTYRIRVTVAVGGQALYYDIALKFQSDVALRISYTLEGREQSVLCQSGGTKTAEDIYDDQLEADTLSYRLTLEGADSDRVTLSEIRLFQTGSGKFLSPGAQGQVKLLLNGGKTGQNTFTVTATRDTGETYTFTVNLPYKHRGDNSVTIDVVNLTQGQKVINEAPLTLRVLAWSQASGQYIPARGTDTRLEVTLDGEIVEGLDLEYTVYPQNPEEGDTNTHVLRVYAEDAFGNYGEKELYFLGQRRQQGGVAGTATIYVDMTVLGLGVVGPLSYQVLAEEPLSYSVVKAILGQDTGDPFGAAKESLGWSGQYSGTLDVGFYLSSLTTGLTANALEGGSWPGSTDAEILAAIDSRFGARTGLATLWRCIYRNGLDKSTGSGTTFGEFDYTSGSGWLYSIGGTYYPGQSMSSLYLKDGDVLFLRYSLAYGWDVGSGSGSYGSPLGYCVTARGGDWSIHHDMEEVTAADGTVTQVCRCCGIVETCRHANTHCADLGDGTHVTVCQDCQAMLGTPAYHQWSHGEDTDFHFCALCGSRETHFWRELGGSTASCTQPGISGFACDICAMVKEETVPATGHTLDNRWNYDTREHYRKCSQCQEEFDRGTHSYVYDGVWDDFVCGTCGCLHEFDLGCYGEKAILSATCQQILYRCGGCGYTLAQSGSFDQYHSYENGSCRHCGQPDPTAHTHDYQPGQTEAPDCETEGYQMYVCSCGDFYTTPIAATGHSWSGWAAVTDPTPESPGEEMRVCGLCGQEQRQPLYWQEP